MWEMRIVRKEWNITIACSTFFHIIVLMSTPLTHPTHTHTHTTHTPHTHTPHIHTHTHTHSHYSNTLTHTKLLKKIKIQFAMEAILDKFWCIINMLLLYDCSLLWFSRLASISISIRVILIMVKEEWNCESLRGHIPGGYLQSA